MPSFKVKYAPGLKRGDLCVFSGYMGKLYAGVFWGEGNGTLQFAHLTDNTLKCIQAGKKPYIDYIGGTVVDKRVALLDPTALDKEEADIYNEIKQYIK